ncbi:succinyl-CoA:acetate CoA-transferase [Fibrobacter sp. UWH9]|uniref:acetyl-CoA hydrolase/transferase family protein n=1 Tax=unclassified Fibrobacter TaxID=2634177 RepID=UPI000913AF9C|nr:MULTISPECIES: acetyl-CoA hydrolase/transferase family protein [unclassified Fibrobacter]SHH17216.1 succinyl-CoA:acetate CoA-transferase [Fibrobacter sp. UWH9]SHL19878.1 succinyl-CoA:acetate CoA-transferase [Fibrobacter sp. UWH5]
MSWIESRKCSAAEAAEMIKDGDVLGVSGFTLAGYPKVVPTALAERAERLHANGEPFKITLFSGASTGDSCDGALARADAVSFRMPYQSNPALRKAINGGSIKYIDAHLGKMGYWIRTGALPRPTVAIVEVTCILPDGRVCLSTSGGNSVTYLEMADRVILELNTRFGDACVGIHDVALPDLPPHAKSLAIDAPGDRVGEAFACVNPEKVVAIVEQSRFDEVTPFVEPDEISRNIGERILDFVRFEEKRGRLLKGLAYQSGVGKVANAVLSAMAADDRLSKIDLYTEVIQEAVLPLLKNGKLGIASGTALTLSESTQKEFVANAEEWKKHLVIRQQEVSNSPDVIKRIGVISMNTALEVDIFGNVNSSLVAGSAMMNGIGGSADFARNCLLGFFMTPSVAKNGTISSVVPYVSHVDHPDHDTMIFVTEQGLADLRGLPAEERARLIIKNCAHPNFKEPLADFLEFSLKHAKGVHVPLALSRAFEMHEKFLETGSML